MIELLHCFLGDFPEFILIGDWPPLIGDWFPLVGEPLGESLPLIGEPSLNSLPTKVF